MEDALAAGLRNLEAAAPNRPRILCLAERAGCFVFRRWLLDPASRPAGFEILPAGPAAVRLATGGEDAYVVIGRQIATAERLEVLCIGADTDAPDGQPLEETIAQVVADGGAPVLAWGFGKWLTGGRTALVRDAFARHPGLAAGDSTMRPRGWPEFLFRRAGCVVAGSDALPLAGEAARIGSFASVFDAAFDPLDPAKSVRTAILGGAARIHNVGRRCGLGEVLRRNKAMKTGAAG